MITQQFILAGHSIFTIEEPTGLHHTYLVQYVEANGNFPASYLVKFLSGPDNMSDYTYLGKLDDFYGVVMTTAKSKHYEGTRKLKLLNRVLCRIWGNEGAVIEAAGYKVHHEGKCGRCGRTLTVPSSVESGFGPECGQIFGIETPEPTVVETVEEDAQMDKMIQDAEMEEEYRRCEYKMSRDEELFLAYETGRMR